MVNAAGTSNVLGEARGAQAGVDVALGRVAQPEDAQRQAALVALLERADDVLAGWKDKTLAWSVQWEGRVANGAWNG